MRPIRFTVDAWRGVRHAVLELEDGMLRAAGEAHPSHRLPGTLSAGVHDRHVHLGLLERSRLSATSVVAADDLGWLPKAARGFRVAPPDGVEVRIAGPFLAPPSGYPSGRPWAPSGAVRPVADPAAAVTAIAEAVALGASFAKVTLHAGFPDFGPGVLGALVTEAHAAHLEVVAHVEGPGMARRALQAGVDALAHVPWTEELGDDDVRAFAEGTAWISTLGLHRGTAARNALGNAARFLAAGGTLLYGTDLGNGAAAPGVLGAEVRALGRAGLDGPGLLAALTGDRGGALPARAAVWSPDPLPTHAPGVARWFAGARRFDPDDLRELR